MLPGKPPRHRGVAHKHNNNGELVKVSVKNGIATGRLTKLPPGQVVKRLRQPYTYSKPTHSVPKSPHRPAAPPVVQTTTLKHEEPYKPSGPGDTGEQSPPIGSRYGGSRKRRRYTKRRGRR